MKPDWKDAPEWAKWLAMDENGDWFWFEFSPTIDNEISCWEVRRGTYQYAWSEYAECPEWQESLKAKPE